MTGGAGSPARVSFRRRTRPNDLPALRRLVVSTGVFYADELEVALELLQERLRLGARSGYEFFFAEQDGELIGYCTWGPVPLTKASFDLYWIAVAPNAQGLGVGKKLMALAEAAVARRGGGRLYIETSSRAVYARTRRFYRAASYRRAARLEDFYAPGDHKIVFCKSIAPAAGRTPPPKRARLTARKAAKKRRKRLI
jgi:ribosomal protein S18 acetylase RimI-like enzyme